MAFEPGKNAYARLTENLALNPWRNIQTYPVAVTDREGEAVLHLAGDIADSSANLYQAAACPGRPGSLPDGRSGPFPQVRGLRAPDLIKLDVEGAELAVLQGADGLINDSPPLWLMEMEEKNLQAAGASKEAIRQFLSGYGYRAAHLKKGRWYATTDLASVKGRNIFWFNRGWRPTVTKRGCRSRGNINNFSPVGKFGYIPGIRRSVVLPEQNVTSPSQRFPMTCYLFHSRVNISSLIPAR